MCHEGIARGAVHDVGKEHGQRTLAVARGKVGERGGIVGFHQASFHGGEGVEYLAQRPAAAGWRDELQDLVGEYEQADVVVVLDCAVRQVERGVDGGLESWPTVDLGGEQPSGVDHHHHLLPTFILVLAAHQLPASCRRLPVDGS